MHYEEEVFTTQFPIAKQFVYHLACYNMLNAGYIKSHYLQPEFWVPTIDAHLLQAAILWCNVFGGKRSSPIHWERLSNEDSKRLQASFWERFPPSLALSLAEWEKYRKEMTNFRNKYAAHRELYNKENIPRFDTALKVVYYYDNWVRKVISPDVFDEPPLKTTYKRLTTENALFIEQLFATTMAFSRNASRTRNK